MNKPRSANRGFVLPPDRQELTDQAGLHKQLRAKKSLAVLQDILYQRVEDRLNG